ncbi:unnamed protein product [Sphacelaria rigidula]
MYVFILSFIIFYGLITLKFETTMKPALTRLGTNKIVLPNRLIEVWLLVTATLFPLNSVLKARKSDFDLKETLSFLALIFGVFLGMIADVSM